jgi:hypothetical protein
LIFVISAILQGMPDKRKRSITPLMVGHPLDEGPLGRTAEHFFTEGEEHEARGWDDVLPLDDEPDPRRRGGSVDKLPRRWSAIFALVALCVCLIAGAAAAGVALFAKGRGGPVASLRSWLSLTSGESTAVPSPNPLPPETPPQTNPAPLVQPLTPSQAVLPRQAAEQAPAAVPPTAKTLAMPARVPRPTEKAKAAAPSPNRQAAPSPNRQAAPPPDLEGQERLRQDAIATRRRRHRSQPRDNYVWSSELNALVPASSMPMVEQPPARPDPSAGRPSFGSPR